MPSTEENIIVSTRDFFVTENVLNPKATYLEVSEFIRKSKTNGELRYVVNQGGVRSVVIVERVKIGDQQSNEIRRMMGIDSD